MALVDLVEEAQPHPREMAAAAALARAQVAAPVAAAVQAAVREPEHGGTAAGDCGGIRARCCASCAGVRQSLIGWQQ